MSPKKTAAGITASGQATSHRSPGALDEGDSRSSRTIEIVIAAQAAATIKGLDQLKDPHEEAANRGVDVEKLIPFWDRGKDHG